MSVRNDGVNDGADDVRNDDGTMTSADAARNGVAKNDAPANAGVADNGSTARDDAATVTFDDAHVLANPWGVDLADRRNLLKVASERLSLVRYVFLVQIEDGIASAAQRASLEYADAVLIGWPETDAADVVDVDDERYREVVEQIVLIEDYIDRFRTMERDNDIDGMTDTLIRITERVAHVRRAFQPSFLLPTFAEIRRVVQDEWNEDMGKIDPDGDAADDRAQELTLQQEIDRVAADSAAAGAEEKR